MDRRDFMKAAIAAGALWRTGFAAEPRIKLAVKYGMVAHKGSVQERFALVKRLGYDGIELPSPAKFDADEVLKARDATGLEIHGVVDSVHWRQTLSDPDEKVRAAGRAGLETAIRDCKRFGGSTVLLVPAVVNKRVPYDAAYERSMKEIRRVLPLAADKKIRIALENVWNNFLLSPVEAARYVDELESEWVGWYFDVGNVVRYGWPEQWIRILNKRIVKLDIKEYSRKKGFGVPIGEGDVDWPAVRKSLSAMGYKEGWATAEVKGGDEKRLAEIKRRMDGVLRG